MAADEESDAKKKAIEKMEEARQRVAAKEAAEADATATSDSTAAPDSELPTVETEKLAKKKSLKKSLEDMTLDNVKVYSPFKVYFDGEAQSISGVNGTGPFDVLPGHKNFMSLLKKCTLVVRTKRGTESIPIDRGVMHVRSDQVTVFLDV